MGSRWFIILSDSALSPSSLDNLQYIPTFFRDNNIKNMNLPDFFDYIVEYIEELK